MDEYLNPQEEMPVGKDETEGNDNTYENIDFLGSPFSVVVASSGALAGCASLKKGRQLPSAGDDDDYVNTCGLVSAKNDHQLAVGLQPIDESVKGELDETTAGEFEAGLEGEQMGVDYRSCSDHRAGQPNTATERREVSELWKVSNGTECDPTGSFAQAINSGTLPKLVTVALVACLLLSVCAVLLAGIALHKASSTKTDRPLLLDNRLAEGVDVPVKEQTLKSNDSFGKKRDLRILKLFGRRRQMFHYDL